MLFSVWLCPNTGAKLPIAKYTDMPQLASIQAYLKRLYTRYKVYTLAPLACAKDTLYPAKMSAPRTPYPQSPFGVLCSLSPSAPPLCQIAVASASDLAPVGKGVTRFSELNHLHTHRPEGRHYYSEPTSIREDGGKGPVGGGRG